MTDEERVIVLRDIFELNARFERLKALWPNQADHLDEVDGILRGLLAEAKEMCRRRDFVTEAVHKAVNPHLRSAPTRIVWSSRVARQS